MGDGAAIVGLGMLVLGWLVVSVVLPLMAMALARRARREVGALAGELSMLRRELTALRRERAHIPPPPSEQPSATPPPPAVTPSRAAARAPAIIVVEAPSPPAAEAPPDLVIGRVAPPTAPSSSLAVAEGPPPSAAAPASTDAPPPSIQDAPGSTLEEQIALVWFTRIGAAVLLLGVAWFFKYAVDNDWIGPLGRVALGALAGVAVLVAGEVMRPRTRTVYVQVLTGVGLALLFVSAYAAHAFYHLVPAPAAFAAVAVVTLLGGALAIHHRGEAILILSLIAGLLSPVLLSTGEDRAAALFAYLLVLTAFAFWAALRMSFRWATWLAIVGPALLFAGWYGRFFDAAPPPAHPAVDAPAATLAGAYFPFARRAAPLLAVAAFFAQWVAVYAAARRRQLAGLWPLAILCAAALAAHAGFAALLYDRTVVLGAVLAALAVASSLLFGREQRRELLLLPLGASFIVLVVTLHGAARPDVIGVLVLLALWGAIYARAFLQDQLGGGRAPSPTMLWSVGAVGLGVTIAAGVLLLEQQPRVFGVTLTVLSLAFALLAVVAARPLVAAIAVAVSLVGFGLITSVVPGHEHRLIAIFAAWAAVYLGSIAWDVLRRGAALSSTRVAIFSAAGLGFALLAEAQTRDSEWLLRAALLAAVGAIDLAFGAALVARARGGATVVLGQALALFAGAVGFVFAGATLTLVWAAMAAVVAVLAAAEQDRAWLAGAAALFAVALLHLVSVDLELEALARDLYFSSGGKLGRLRQPLVFNARSYALVGTAAALLVAARAAWRCRPRAFQLAAAALVVAAHVLLLGFCIAEVHSAVVHTPTPPPGLDPNELTAFYGDFLRARLAATQTVRMTTTLVLGGYAALLVAVGFGARERLHRYLGLSLFAITVAKLALYDIWALPRVLQMLVLLAVGALLLGASFLYARFGRRLVALLRDGGVDAPKAALVLFVCLAAARAHAFDASKLEFERTVENVNGSGLYRADVDAELYRHARSDSLADVRIADPDGKEVPFLLRRVPAPEQPVAHAVTVVDPVQLPDGAARALLDLGAPGLKHSEVTLAIAAKGDWFRKARIEISTDESTWALLAEGPYVFRVTAGGTVAERTTLVHPVSDARYLRITLLPAAGPPVAITGATVAWVPPEAHVPLHLLPAVKPQPVPKPGEARASEYIVDLGAPGVPIAELALDISDAAFERRSLVGAANHQQYWTPLTATLLYRVDPAGTFQHAEENVRFTLPSSSAARDRYFRLTVYNGDDAPLTVRSVSPAFVAEELIFRAGRSGVYTLYLGGDLPPPSYDLAAVLARSGERPTLTANCGTIVPNPSFGHLAAPPPTPASERYKLPIGLGLTLLLALLALWALRLMRRARAP